MHIYTYRWILRFSIFPKIFKGPRSTWMRVFENYKVRITPKTKGKPYCAVIHSAYLVLIIPFKSFHGKPVVSKGRSWCIQRWVVLSRTSASFLSSSSLWSENLLKSCLSRDKTLAPWQFFYLYNWAKVLKMKSSVPGSLKTPQMLLSKADSSGEKYLNIFIRNRHRQNN